MSNKFKRRKPKTANATKHGGFAEVARYRERKTDMRTKDDRALKLWQNSIIEDCGGAAEMDALQVSLLDRCTEALIILRHMAEYVEDKGVVKKDGGLTKCLKSSYISYSNSFRLMLESIYSRIGKKPSKVPSLKDIIEAHDKESD